MTTLLNAMEQRVSRGYEARRGDVVIFEQALSVLVESVNTEEQQP